ncbi:helix-turn-helix transcriptional regulator [Paenibacillus ginsengarvi]|uniref:AraC family transcriptional regulator n=1 Tax=Paenibacillus ginsengarvi TaxID=400777 RepID=A0A3B0BFW1_9BACL|nr:AraC family transcriptional regulator [Paenibacillus ginsengarvi]RKN71204.1 AraC family transcriptional regulator [Paenibacillus ginsengarvi]
MTTAGKPVNPIRFLQEMSDQLTLRIRACLEDTHESGWSESKVHSDYDVWLLYEGSIDIRIGESVHRAEAGDLVFYYPHVPYTASTNEGRTRFMFVHFDFGIGDQLRILDSLPLAGIVPGGGLRDEISLMRQSYEQRRSRKSGIADLKLKGAFTLLVARVIELYEAGEYVGVFPGRLPRQSRSKGLSSLQPVFEYINRRTHLPLRTKELADAAGLSEKYFITYFKQTLGMTPSQYIYQLKMNKAREYLYQRNYSIKEIASLLGYPDPYSFSKSFKAYFHVPPSQFV